MDELKKFLHWLVENNIYKFDDIEVDIATLRKYYCTPSAEEVEKMKKDFWKGFENGR